MHDASSTYLNAVACILFNGEQNGKNMETEMSY